MAVLGKKNNFELLVYPLPVNDHLAFRTSVYGKGMVEDYLIEDFRKGKTSNVKIRSKGNNRGD